MSEQDKRQFPVEITKAKFDHRQIDGRLKFEAGDDLAAIADLVSDIYMEMKRTKRNELAHVFGLAYLTVLEEMDRPGCGEHPN